MSRTRGTWNTKGMWLAGGVLAAVLALTGYAIFSGDDGGSAPTGKSDPSPSASSSASAAPTYQVPDDWTEPERWVALPRGARTDKYGSQVGFPHTTEGAVAMMAAANRINVENGSSTVDEQLRIYHSYMGADGRSSQAADQIELDAMQADKELHKEMGVAPGSRLPAGAYMRSTVVGYMLLKKSPDEVSGWLLSLVTTKAGETEKEERTYTRTLAAVRWEGGDWKLSADATARALQQAQNRTAPKMAAPGDAEFNRIGWTAIREAS